MRKRADPIKGVARFLYENRFYFQTRSTRTTNPIQNAALKVTESARPEIAPQFNFLWGSTCSNSDHESATSVEDDNPLQRSGISRRRRTRVLAWGENCSSLELTKHLRNYECKSLTIPPDTASN